MTISDWGDSPAPGELIVQVPVDTKSATIPPDTGYPWSVAQLNYVEYDANRSKYFLPEPGNRSWSVEYILSNNIDLTHEQTSLDHAAIGSSHLRIQGDTDLRMTTDSGKSQTFTLLSAPDGTLGKIVFPVTADDPLSARLIAGRAITGLLGVLSFLGNIPLYVRQEIVRDPSSGWARFWVALPAPPPTLGRVSIRLPPQLRPVYALWRESRNTQSYFYKFLCLFKIVDGLLQRVLPSVYEEMVARGKDYEPPTRTVPADRHISAATPELVGRRFTRVRNDLRSQYRNAVAHFDLNAAPPLDVDDPNTRSEYERLFPVVDFMARTLIAEAERLFLP